MYQPILRVHFIFDDVYAIVFFIFFIKANVVGTHLNCINKSMQHNIYLYKEVDKKYTGCNLKTIELLHCALDCALIGVCAVTRLNMVI